MGPIELEDGYLAVSIDEDAVWGNGNVGVWGNGNVGLVLDVVAIWGTGNVGAEVDGAIYPDGDTNLKPLAEFGSPDDGGDFLF